MTMIYEAKHSFSTEDQAGARVHVNPGDTAREGHWLLAKVPDAFKPLRVRFEVEAAPTKRDPAPPPPPAPTAAELAAAGKAAAAAAAAKAA